MAIYIEKLDDLVRDEDDNSYKLTADFAMKLQFFCSLKIRQQRMMIEFGGIFAIHLFNHLSHCRRFIPAQTERKQDYPFLLVSFSFFTLLRGEKRHFT